MRSKNYIKWFLFAWLSLLLLACNSSTQFEQGLTAKFEYSPTAPSIGEVVKFDGTKSTVDQKKKPVQLLVMLGTLEMVQTEQVLQLNIVIQKLVNIP